MTLCYYCPWEEANVFNHESVGFGIKMTRNANEHVREIESIVLNTNSHAIPDRDYAVKASWRRCVEQYRLEPGKAYQVPVLTQSRLREHQDAADELIKLSSPWLDRLYRVVKNQDYTVSLLDENGVIVRYLGEKSIDGDIRQAKLHLGSMWTEEHAGTCAGGSCIAVGEALTIHHDDHFDVRLTQVTCTAAPIFNTNGDISAILNISALSSPKQKASQEFGLHMVAMTGRRIELASLMASTRYEWVLYFSHEPEFIDRYPEGAVALDGSGRIIGLTHAGRKFLAKGIGADWRTLGDVSCRPISDFLEFDINDLPSLTGAASLESRIVRGHSGNAIFAHAISRQVRPTLRGTHSRESAFAALSAGDRAMSELSLVATKLAPTKLPIFIRGETGTGKERLAQAIHQTSRRDGRFVPVNCAALPEALIEGELFGYAPGAFTGASSKGRKGLIEEADGGTLFLDEIGDMPLALQARLLRVLSEGEVLPLGSLKHVKVDVRIVSATHQDLLTLIDRRLFREDLYHRIAGVTLTLPSLCERSDFDWLVDILIRETDRPQILLSHAAREALKRHRWPGNIRELKNVLSLAAVVAEGPSIELCDLPEVITSASSVTASLSRRAQSCAAEPDVGSVYPGSAVRGSEAADFTALLDQHCWNISELARIMKVDRSTLHRRIKRLGLVSPNRRMA